VHQDDGTAKLRLGFHSLKLIENGLGDFFRGLVNTLVPIVGVDLVAYHYVALVLKAHDRGSLIVCLRFFVNVVRRPDIQGLNA